MRVNVPVDLTSIDMGLIEAALNPENVVINVRPSDWPAYSQSAKFLRRLGLLEGEDDDNIRATDLCRSLFVINDNPAIKELDELITDMKEDLGIA